MQLIKIFFILLMLNIFVSCSDENGEIPVTDIVNTGQENNKLPKDTEEIVPDIIEEVEEKIEEELISEGPSLIEIECDLDNKKKRKCMLPQEEKGATDENGKKIRPLRIVKIHHIVDKGNQQCELNKNLILLNSLKGIKIIEECEGIFKVETTRNLKYKKYGSKLGWNQLEISALDFGEAIIEGESLLSNNSSGSVTNDKNGIGVAGGQHAPNQINFDPQTNLSQGLLFSLPEGSIGFNLVVSNLYKAEASGERGILYVLDEDYNIIFEKIIAHNLAKYKNEDRGHVGQVKIRGISGAKYLLVKALNYTDENASPTDAGDFYVRYLNVLSVTE